MALESSNVGRFTLFCIAAATVAEITAAGNNYFQFFHEYFYVSDPITLIGWHLRRLFYPENNGGIRTDGRSGDGVAAETAMPLDTVAAV